MFVGEVSCVGLWVGCAVCMFVGVSGRCEWVCQVDVSGCVR